MEFQILIIVMLAIIAQNVKSHYIKMTIIPKEKLISYKMNETKTTTTTTVCDKLNPCLNSGKCVDIGDDYKCICKGIYSGFNCEYCRCYIDSNECSVNGNGLCRTSQVPKQNSKHIIF